MIKYLPFAIDESCLTKDLHVLLDSKEFLEVAVREGVVGIHFGLVLHCKLRPNSYVLRSDHGIFDSIL